MNADTPGSGLMSQQEEQLRAAATALRGRLLEEARQQGARHVVNYLEAQAEAFIAAYVDIQRTPDKVVPTSPFLYTLT